MAHSSIRNTKYTVLGLALALLIILYLATGASSTRNSQFYKRTLDVMEGRNPDVGHPESTEEAPTLEVHEPVKRWPNIADPKDGSNAAQANLRNSVGGAGLGGDSQHAGQLKPGQPEQSLKERLREAEKMAKKSADEKYQALRDIEAEIQKERKTRQEAAAKSDAAKASATSGASGPRDLAPGEKSIAGRTKMPAAAKEAADSLTRGMLEKLVDKTDYMSPLTPQPNETEEERTLRESYASFLSASPVVIFSKSYCPFSKKAKRILLESHTITPSPKVVELDEHLLGMQLQKLLEKITGRRTVPNILVNGKTIGGGDEIEMLWKSGELPARLRQMGGKRIQKVVENVAYGEGGLNAQHQGLRRH